MLRTTAALLTMALSPISALGADLAVRVRDTAGVARNGEVVRSGIPIPRALNLRSTAGLAVVDSGATAIPAQFHILARWNAGLSDVSAPIQWLLVFFPATVAANGTSAYRLVLDGSVSTPPPAQPLRVTQTGNRVVVETGAATFTIDADRSSLFEEIRRGAAPLVTGGSLTLRANDRDAAQSVLRRLTVERAGPVAATVVIDGAYDFPSVGGGGLGTRRRYEFSAGSPSAIIRHSVAWEGDLCQSAGAIECGGAPNAVRIQRVRDTLRLSLGGTAQTAIVGARDAASVRGATSLRQRLRNARTASPRFDIDASNAGGKADGATLSVEGSEGSVAVALDHMHRYEPQALRHLEDGSLAVDIVDDNAWLATRQGLFATMAVSVLPPSPSRGDLESRVWAPLNHPLRAWPDARWFALSEAVDDVPAGALPDEFAGYDTAIDDVLRNTVARTDDLGVFGLMTWGSFPRTWGDPIFSDEIDCFGNDPTPQESWDDLFWCSTWTDYHNASFTAVVAAMRAGTVEWLDEIARPAALRMLHTQILQCSPADTYFYCGQAPAGYGGFRADFNSSHAYFDNLQLHYWLTGDSTVLETLQRGARSMRDYLCTRRPAAACAENDPPVDEWANLTGRVASQWFSVFRFAGLAGDDASYLDDYRANLARALTQQYVAAERDGRRFGFFLAGTTPVTAPGTHSSDQLWMTALYDMRMLERIRRDTGDAPIGSPPLRPSEVITAFARTLQTYGPSTAPGNNGSVFGPWPNALDFTWSGARIGGALIDVRANTGGSDPLLYDTGKAVLAAPVAGAAVWTADPSLRDLAVDLVQLAIDATIRERAPLGKIPAEYTVRLHSAIATLVPPPPDPPRRRAVRR
jgi:hypothetical protein